MIVETKNYMVSTGVDGDGTPGYTITNKEYGVVEHFTTVLPQALRLVHEFELLLEGLDTYIETLREGMSKVQTMTGSTIQKLKGLKSN